MRETIKQALLFVVGIMELTDDEKMGFLVGEFFLTSG